MRAVKLFVAGVVGLAGMSVVGAPAQAGGSDPDQLKTVTMPLRIEKKLRATPIPEGTSYYCAVGVFVSFNDIKAFKPLRVEYKYFGDASEPIGPAPYDDKAAMNGIAFPPVGAKHQTQIGEFSYSQGGYATPEAAAAECEAMRQRVDAFFDENTAKVVFDHTPKCRSALTKAGDAKKKMQTAKNRLEHAHGPAVAAALAAYKDAKAKHKKAKKKAKRACK